MNSLKKPKTPRSSKYLKWIRLQPCLITHQNEVEASHIRIGNHAGMGQKPSDFRVLPLKGYLHRKLHTMGERSFYDHYDINPDMECNKLLIKYIISKSKNERELLEWLEEMAGKI